MRPLTVIAAAWVVVVTAAAPVANPARTYIQY